MADTEGMRLLITHAADRLNAERGAMGEHGNGTRSTIAAMALAEGTLRMVAACMGVEETAQPAPIVAAPVAEPAPEPRADGVRRTQRMRGNS